MDRIPNKYWIKLIHEMCIDYENGKIADYGFVTDMEYIVFKIKQKTNRNFIVDMLINQNNN